MDEQRCELPKPIEKSKSTEDMLDMVERVQGDRMNEQRSDLPADDDPSLISTYYMSGRDIILGSLSSDVFERRTSTGSEVFSLLTCLDDIKFVFLSFFTVMEAI